MPMRWNLALLFLLAVVSTLSAEESAPPTGAAPAPAAPPPRSAAAESSVPTMEMLDDKHRFQVGEQILFRIVEDRDPSVALGVMDSGDAIFPYIGRVRTQGKTARELARELKVLLEKDYYYQATVIIGLNENVVGARGSIFVSGEVNRPGTVQIPKERRLMLSEAIIAAGGFQQFADQRKVRVIRKKAAGTDGKTTEELVVDVKAVLDEGRVAKDLELLPEDRVVVRAKLVNF